MHLCIEIAEQLVLKDNEHNLKIIAELKALGVKIAIADFDIGYSCLSYIGRFGPSELKVDTSLIRNVVANPSNAAIVTTAIAMAHSL